jgi:hypothetical protein
LSNEIAGYFCPEPATPAPLRCNANQACPSGTGIIQSCAAGTFLLKLSSYSLCSSCFPGRYCAGGETNPIACDGAGSCASYKQCTSSSSSNCNPVLAPVSCSVQVNKVCDPSFYVLPVSSFQVSAGANLETTVNSNYTIAYSLPQSGSGTPPVTTLNVGGTSIAGTEQQVAFLGTVGGGATSLSSLTNVHFNFAPSNCNEEFQDLRFYFEKLTIDSTFQLNICSASGALFILLGDGVVCQGCLTSLFSLASSTLTVTFIVGANATYTQPVTAPTTPNFVFLTNAELVTTYSPTASPTSNPNAPNGSDTLIIIVVVVIAFIVVVSARVMYLSATKKTKEISYYSGEDGGGEVVAGVYVVEQPGDSMHKVEDSPAAGEIA